jgi:hypothetical protein
MKTICLIAMIVFLAPPVIAQPATSPRATTFKDYKTTADYVRDCGGPTVSVMGCMAAYASVQTAPGHPTYCTPDTSTSDRQEGMRRFTALIISLVDWLKIHPEYSNKPYAQGLSAASLGRYPCNSTTQVRCVLPSVRPSPLSHEQAAVFQLEAREKTKNMSLDEVRAWRREWVCNFYSMSKEEDLNYRKQLQARWDALPTEEKAQLLKPGIPASQRPQNQR